ncbi:Thioesterase/thiol ester dehydrase-isomerase [Cylindrobasidium torrendii FP15055 ss-10]|uniref:Thioesterase/thiol ester dehydrase-isomerase n=1 Tax=Cylindrobasidium torrendii FP15055 ss-10 TaxID=1314674 RepID=A0A0D7AUS8_9AGAR|nr:Thioesterase/thiol ester dehydrase-isomerase [Cylindrobasidium torrendii FP15055 ss-10]
MDGDSSPLGDQAEHELISTALDVERLEVNMFRSKSLWLPRRARGVFGGQVISQALVSATNCVDPIYALHVCTSMQCYFLLSASPATPIVYSVEVMRTGRSYMTCSVKAIQNGAIIFVLLCSFQKPEPWQPEMQWQMPSGVPMPDECSLEEDIFLADSKRPGIDPRLKYFFETYAEERRRSPISIKRAAEHQLTPEGHIRYMYWMRAKSIPKYDAPFQKCILAYLSDLYFIMSVPRMIGLKRWAKGPDALGLVSSVDHTIHFYDNDFDCADWLLYTMEGPRVASGRGIARGQLYTTSGTLVAVTTQEGVIRAQRRDPALSKL